MLRLDHVVYAVPDLDEAAVRFRERYGLDSTEGGRHERWGTANRIVPLGEQYLELVAVVDEAGGRGDRVRARACSNAPPGAADGSRSRRSPTTSTRSRHVSGSRSTRGSRTRPDGETVRWRSAGLDDPRREPWMPFFLAWDVPDELHPGRARAGPRRSRRGHRVGRGGRRRRATPRVARWRRAADPGDRRRAGHPPGRGLDRRRRARDRVSEGGGPLMRPSAARCQSSGWK